MLPCPPSLQEEAPPWLRKQLENGHSILCSSPGSDYRNWKFGLKTGLRLQALGTLQTSPAELGLIYQRQALLPLFDNLVAANTKHLSVRRQRHLLAASSTSPRLFFFFSPFGLFSPSRELQFPSKSNLTETRRRKKQGEKVLAQLLLKEVPRNSCTGACNSLR